MNCPVWSPTLWSCAVFSSISSECILQRQEHSECFYPPVSTWTSPRKSWRFCSHRPIDLCTGLMLLWRPQWVGDSSKTKIFKFGKIPNPPQVTRCDKSFILNLILYFKSVGAAVFLLGSTASIIGRHIPTGGPAKRLVGSDEVAIHGTAPKGSGWTGQEVRHGTSTVIYMIQVLSL